MEPWYHCRGHLEGDTVRHSQHSQGRICIQVWLKLLGIFSWCGSTLQGDPSGQILPPVDLLPMVLVVDGPLLYISTAQAGWRNVPNPSQREVLTIQKSRSLVNQRVAYDSPPISRLCKVGGGGIASVTEECFRQGHLNFSGPNQWLLYLENGDADIQGRDSTTLGVS